MKMLELDVIKQAQKGNSESFGQIYDIFADALFRYIRTKVQSKQQAEDLLQETFLKVWRGLPKLKVDEGLKFRPWLYRVAANCVNDHFRKIYSRPESLELDENLEVTDSRSPATEMIINSDIETIKAAMEKLPAQYKEIIELRFVQDIDAQECAKILNKNPVSVRVLQYRALESLKKLLKNI